MRHNGNIHHYTHQEALFLDFHLGFGFSSKAHCHVTLSKSCDLLNLIVPGNGRCPFTHKCLRVGLILGPENRNVNERERSALG